MEQVTTSCGSPEMQEVDLRALELPPVFGPPTRGHGAGVAGCDAEANVVVAPSADKTSGTVCCNSTPAATAFRRLGSGKLCDDAVRHENILEHTMQAGVAQQDGGARPAPGGAAVLLDLERAGRRLSAWTRTAAPLEPRIAAGRCPDRVTLQRLQDEGCGFSCTTADEVQRVLAIGAPPSSVIVSNPLLPRAHLRHVRRLGVDLFSFESMTQLRKMTLDIPDARFLLSISADEESAKGRPQPGARGLAGFAPRLGARRDDWRPLLALAKESRLTVVGVVLAAQPAAGLAPSTGHSRSLTTSLRRAKEAMDLLIDEGFEPETLDVGPGLLDGCVEDDAGANGDDGGVEQLAVSTAEQVEAHVPLKEFPKLRVSVELSQHVLGQGVASFAARTPTSAIFALGVARCGGEDTEQAQAQPHPNALLEQLQDFPVMSSILAKSLAKETPQAEGDWLIWKGLGSLGCVLAKASVSEFAGESVVQVLHHGPQALDTACVHVET
mmetsp:Transcript_104341/g.290595  ORF Transcript_104341/g.290595 Transcript_104341/m.290595 type:complete len:496 (+) Transcript_104341:117-1604(+)